VTYRYFRSVAPPECAKVEYPAAAEAARETGRVTVQMHVDASGAMQPATLLESSGHALLDEAAMNSLSRCTGAELRRAFDRPDQTFVYDFHLD
jgi:TonB family protein